MADESEAQLHYNPYGYLPSRSAAASFIGLFGLCTLMHNTQTLFGRRRVWWTLVFTAGGIMEILGWTGRLISSFDPYQASPYLMQIITLIIAPAWFSAGCYAVTGAFIHRIGREQSPLGARAFNYIFVGCDMVSIVLQGVGGATAGKEADRGETPEKGRAIMLAGIVFQLASMLVFVFLSVQFYKRRWTDLSRPRPRLVWSTMFASLCIIARGIFRTAELSEGWKGFLFRHEIFQIDLDGFPIVLCMLAFNFGHPTYTLDNGQDEGQRAGSFEGGHNDPSAKSSVREKLAREA
ncbi:RTA1-domain-containing protein [Serendipita vermifera]|nr:RTA1-domain-containing protein [Serendipita vermifera]